MMTEQQVFGLEHEIQWWHEQRFRPETPRLEQSRHLLSPLTDRLRRLVSGWSTPSEQAEMLKTLRLELLRAVARGEISPETAHRVLSARP